ncbi:hypothetical protein C0Q70_11975 [Pomacea canaliculata]|uniref:Uncharacterized protein n=1 Tax=Pomacea canaliculata TaxID=400727 RepID=A0A2T7P069_POMCA|nr:hypothetical protein C0Q70_11975 [Pomacea canaliculata]
MAARQYYPNTRGSSGLAREHQASLFRNPGLVEINDTTTTRIKPLQPLFSHPRPTQSPSKTRSGQTTLGPPDTRRPLYSEVVAKRNQPTNHRQDDAAGTLLTTPPYDPPGVRGTPDTVTSRRHQAVLDLLAKLLL